MSDKKYYWLRLDRNFFKRHDIRIIEGMENGKEYVLFYMKLLLESIDHEGSLRFNELIPYNDSMLATITNTNIDIVRSAVKLFQSLDMLEILDNQTIYITDTQKMLGEAKSTDRVRRFREKQLALPDVTACNVTETLHVTELELEKELDIELEKDKGSNMGSKSTRFAPPNIEEVIAYCKEKQNGVDAVKWWNFYDGKNWMVGKNKMTKWKSAIATWGKEPDKPVEAPKPKKYREVLINGEIVMEAIDE